MQSNLIDLLSSREKEVLAHIAKGYTNKKIGELLEISVQTVETHRKHIKTKLKVKTTIELLIVAQQSELI